jgi:hypothetical protein
MVWLQWLIFVVSLALQVFVIGLLRRGLYKDYPFVFVYSLVLIMTTVADGAAFAGVAHMDHAFFRNEALRQLLLFTVVMSLMDRAMRGRPYRNRVRVILILSACLAVLISVQIHWDAHSNHKYNLWATQVGRDLSFGSVVLTLLLWVTLISSRRKDTQLLMVTGGLGLQFTGEAIGQSIRQLSVPHHHILLLVGNLVLTASHLMRLYVWSEAFRRARIIQEIDTDDEPDGDVARFGRQAQQTLAESI